MNLTLSHPQTTVIGHQWVLHWEKHVSHVYKGQGCGSLSSASHELSWMKAKLWRGGPVRGMMDETGALGLFGWGQNCQRMRRARKANLSVPPQGCLPQVDKPKFSWEISYGVQFPSRVWEWVCEQVKSKPTLIICNFILSCQKRWYISSSNHAKPCVYLQLGLFFLSGFAGI